MKKKLIWPLILGLIAGNSVYWGNLLENSALGRWMMLESANEGFIILAITTGVLTTFLVLFINYLHKKWQIFLTFVLLLAVLTIFFDYFNLQYDFIFKKLPYLLEVGLVNTLWISAVSIVIACIIGLLAALGKISLHGFWVGLATFYISFFRGTPLLLQVFLIYQGLPQIGIVLKAEAAWIIALSLGYGAYLAEIFRAGIEGVNRGQREAALALGLSRHQTLYKIILPQAMRLIIPPIGNQFLSMLKDSSLVSIMGIWELMFLARTQGRAEFKHLEMLITAALIYWVISMILEIGQTWLEKHFKPEPSKR